MGAWLGVPASTEDGNGPKSAHNKRDGAGKEAAKAVKKQSSARSEMLGVSQMTGPDVPVDGNEKPIPQHGYEDDKERWVKWAAPPRIKHSRLTAEETAKYRGLLEQIFANETAVRGQRIMFNPHDVMEVMQKVIPYLESESMLIEDVPFDVTIVGDIHGQLHDLDRVFKDAAKDGKPGWECRKFLFLGNYVDEGRQSLEVVMALFCIKMLFPDDIFLLRGNHEFIKCNLEHDFFYDILERYDQDDAKVIYYQINETFCWLSVAAIVGGIYFCAHGGLSPSRLTRHHMRSMRKPLCAIEDDMRMVDMCCAEPATGLKGATYNVHTGSSYCGFDAVSLAMASMEVKAVFRGHTPMKDGFGNSWGVLYTLFTAADYKKMSNKGAVAFIDAKGKLTLGILSVDPHRRAWEAALNKASGDYEEGHQKTICEMGPGSGSVKTGAGKSGKSGARAGSVKRGAGKSGKGKKSAKPAH